MRFYAANQWEINDHPTLFPYSFKCKRKQWLIPERLLPSSIPPHNIKRSSLIRLSDYPFTKWYFPNVNKTYQPEKALKTMLTGRLLLLDEVVQKIPLKLIHEHVGNGYIQYKAGLDFRTSEPTCNRCGNNDSFLFGRFTCSRCKKNCIYCRACLMMGRVTSCTPLLTWEGNEERVMNVPQMAWTGSLTLEQEKASKFLRQQLETLKERKECLVWAVCGAGKTEMLFSLIERALKAQFPILIATPRTDVVLELIPRLKASFPNTDVNGFYGGISEEARYAQSQIYVATTHQVLRYSRFFPLVIIDEVDAFPYTHDKKLQFAIERARASQSLTVYLTATPSKAFKKKVKNEELAYVKVTQRYHGHPLPEPQFIWIGNWRKKLSKNHLPLPLASWLSKHLNDHKQILLFFPAVNVMKIAEKVIKTVFKQQKIDAVYAEEAERREKVMRFRNGHTRLLLTTTILERGITIKDIQVAVLGAEDTIFTEAALVQIAGRAGRSPVAPEGDVSYFHHGKTKAMVDAVNHIKRMNDTF
ncbi:DEAD/DEAH box helicase [Salipaludibacillus agaradhaerens]|uniref:DEAD/DEAH box helicase n=1 Tax=Salipaludibacillus agaradhaerens TaxID=76935 RepID=UPI0009974924|nr:DEAD/DEAH box helicase family protein [Salipaludibacillus agaradhaerens]